MASFSDECVVATMEKTQYVALRLFRSDAAPSFGKLAVKTKVYKDAAEAALQCVYWLAKDSAIFDEEAVQARLETIAENRRCSCAASATTWERRHEWVLAVVVEQDYLLEYLANAEWEDDMEDIGAIAATLPGTKK